MKRHGAMVKLCGAAAAVLSPSAAHAQLDDATIARVMRECRKIADATARVACYDNIPIGEQVQSAPAPSLPATPSVPSQARGFGSNQLVRALPESSSEPDEIAATVASAVEREPGVYLLTLEDGAQWQFVDSAPRSYDPPRRGSTVEIISASMGSYLLRHGEQRALRVRRVR